MLMDGGVANNTPISHAVQLGAREIYVLPSGHACALEQPPSSALGMALHALTLLTQSRLIVDVELHRDQAKLIVLPPPCPLGVQPIDFGHADELIERSLADARAFLDRGGTERPAIRMRMHRHGQPGASKKRSTIGTHAE
jgi:NTE family protein